MNGYRTYFVGHVSRFVNRLLVPSPLSTSSLFSTSSVRRRPYSSRTTPTVPLAADIHEPAGTSLRGAIPADDQGHGHFSPHDPLLILHGLFGSKQNWRGIGRQLAQACGHRVMPVDLRNHGLSPHAKHMDYAIMAKDVDQLVAKDLGASSAILCGHSMGGRVAMTAAVAQPELYSRLIVVDVSPVSAPNGLNTFAGYLGAMQELDRMEVTRRKEAEAYLASHVPDERIRLFLLTNLVSTPTGHLKFRINLSGIASFVPSMWNFDLISPTASQSAPVYSQPALFIRGSRSGYLPNSHLATLMNLFPQAEVATMEGCGHWPHAERPTECVDIVTDWLKRTESP
ncbi:Alpha/Beta hydrolase protein [Catenaria anguillulae PL171]|uniref:Alpha/Beta hydrolase protein n=1 Tax=Catenaria anguillulae PL171 TaxID=765915 RepID=A0A1Y2HPM1_9FUNG|nr:Alpha/Beta hydrolase protein [Catenaria anguillulae PL171]